MSKPQVASEPTLEEILASIRKMISDDKVGPSPMPDQMSRTPFGEHTRTASEQDFNTRTTSEPAASTIRPASSTPSFNSLADALKVATALSDQRRSLQQEIADAVEKGPRSNFDALSEVSATRSEVTRSFSDARTGLAEGNRAALPMPSTRRDDPLSASPGESKRDLLSFDFGAVVPDREELEAKSAEAKSAEAKSAEAKAEPQAESRVLHLRTGLGGGAGLAGPNVSPFPRTPRETVKPSEPDQPVADKAAEPSPAKVEPEPVAVAPQAELQPEPEALVPQAEPASAEAAIAGSEALLDAVIDLVQKDPGAMSVFTSGASFISGVGGVPVVESTALVNAPAPAVVEPVANAAPAPSDPAKVDRAAADLLRPMLRQWLADNMGRILEEALRNELTEQTQRGNGPEKS